MSTPILSISMWVDLSNEERNRIRSLFSIPKSRFAHVDDGRIITDGTTPEDFQALTIEKMQEFTQSGSLNFHDLFDLTILKVRSDISAGVPTVMPLQEVITSVEPKRRGRPAKHEKK